MLGFSSSPKPKLTLVTVITLPSDSNNFKTKLEGLPAKAIPVRVSRAGIWSSHALSFVVPTKKVALQGQCF
jgi:hypothetical protein|tara:strand:+ start:91 stop:303 length:213 start_codon:yes stop_codon:yes gene_type:complete